MPDLHLKDMKTGDLVPALTAVDGHTVWFRRLGVDEDGLPAVDPAFVWRPLGEVGESTEVRTTKGVTRAVKVWRLAIHSTDFHMIASSKGFAIRGALGYLGMTRVEINATSRPLFEV